MNLLEEDDDQANGQVQLKVNRSFASKYEHSKRREELIRSKSLLAAGEEDTETESETEDEDANLLSTEKDLQIIQTINSIKRKDPKIYNNETKWFQEEEGDSEDEEEQEAAKGSKGKKTFKDVAREQLLAGDEDSDDNAGPRHGLQYNQEQSSLRKAFLRSLPAEEEDDEDDDMLTIKPKPSGVEAEEEEKALQKALDEMKELTRDEEDPSHTAFLTNYLTNKLWKAPVTFSAEEADDEDDSDQDDAVDAFESKYNFRFEQLADRKEDSGSRNDLRSKVTFDLQDSAQVQGHARQIPDSLRRVDDKRKVAREAKKERQAHEKRVKEAELRRLKNLKQAELQERLKQIKQFGGVKDELLIDESLLEEDWDPARHEAMMAEQYGDAYYGQEGEAGYEGEGVEEEGMEGQEWMEGEGYEDEGYEEQGYGEGENQAAGAKGEASIQSLLSDLYALDYEDTIGDLKCKFKYRSVEPEAFGLTTEEILFAKDEELNSYVNLKKIAPYYSSRKTGGDEKLANKRRRLRKVWKDRMAEEQPVEEEAQAVEQEEVRKEEKAVYHEEAAGDKKRRRRRKRTEEAQEETAAEAEMEVEQVEEAEDAPPVPAAGVAAGPAVKVKAAHKVKKHKKKKKVQQEDVSKDPVRKRLSLYN